MARVLGELLNAAARANPAGGVIDADARLHSWSELDDAALRIASRLISQGVVKGDRVAVLHPKSVWSFVAVHAIIRCGAVMVPLDPLSPVDAVQNVLDFCQPTAIIGNASTISTRAPDFVREQTPYLIVTGDVASVASLPAAAGQVSTFDEALATDVASWPLVVPEDLAYIIFTSGSTGEPKGIAHTHHSAMAYVANAVTVHGLTTSDRVAGTSPLHFDMSTLELYAAPLAGATVAIFNEGEVRFPVTLSHRFQDMAVTVLYAVPYQLRQLCLRGDIENRDLSSLRQISFGGEQFAPGVLKDLAHALPPAELLNVYGPAEVNGIVSHSWPPHPAQLADVPIGTAWDNVQLRIVDDDLVEVDGGKPGELIVASPSQMAGYWRHPELNKRCFAEFDGRRWYRTGDVVRQDARGLLHFLGRADTRVKVRGVRLELEIIESTLSDGPGVDTAVVGVREDETGLQHVVAWLLPDDTDNIVIGSLRRWCVERLPASAVPSDFRVVNSLPQSRTGKIDRKKLRASLNPDHLSREDNA